MIEEYLLLILWYGLNLWLILLSRNGKLRLMLIVGIVNGLEVCNYTLEEILFFLSNQDVCCSWESENLLCSLLLWQSLWGFQHFRVRFCNYYCFSWELPAKKDDNNWEKTFFTFWFDLPKIAFWSLCLWVVLLWAIQLLQRFVFLEVIQDTWSYVFYSAEGCIWEFNIWAGPFLLY